MLIAGVVAAGYSWRVGVGLIGAGGLVASPNLTWLFAARVDGAVTAPNREGNDDESAAVGGDLSDRISAGPVMVASFAAVAGLVGLFALGTVGPLVAVVLVLLVGEARSIAGPARSKLTDAFAPDGTTGTSFAITTIGVMLGNAVAPPAFGYLIETAGRRAAFLAVAGVSLLAVVLTVWLIARFSDA